eukprot:6197121-Pleurochrysis_carterae.AAC.1
MANADLLRLSLLTATFPTRHHLLRRKARQGCAGPNAAREERRTSQSMSCTSKAEGKHRHGAGRQKQGAWPA